MSDQTFREAIRDKQFFDFFKEHTARQMAVEMALQKLGITQEALSQAVQIARGKVEEAQNFSQLQSKLDSIVGTLLRDTSPASDKPS